MAEKKARRAAATLKQEEVGGIETVLLNMCFLFIISWLGASSFGENPYLLNIRPRDSGESIFCAWADKHRTQSGGDGATEQAAGLTPPVMDGGSESVRMALCKWGRHPSIAPVIMGDGRAACGPPGTKAAILGARCLLLEPEKKGGGRIEWWKGEKGGGGRGKQRKEHVMLSFPHMRCCLTPTSHPTKKGRNKSISRVSGICVIYSNKWPVFSFWGFEWGGWVFPMIEMEHWWNNHE